MADKLAIRGGTAMLPHGASRTWPDIRDEDREAVLRTLDGRPLWGPNAPEVTALQDEFADYVGAKHCLAVNSGTAALHCCLAACGVRPGDEVIVPAFTFVATPMAVLHQGARPVFADIDPRTFNVAPDCVAALVTERTRAIMPVYIHGLPADMDELTAIAERHDLALIEDACQAHGATYKGRNAGTLGVCAGFSLNGAKNLSAAEGGLFVTDDDDIMVAARRLAIFGEDVPAMRPGETRAFWSHGTGWNYRTQEMTAALARSQLTRLDEYNATAQRNAAILSDGIEGIAGVSPPHIPADRTSVYFRYRIRLDAAELGFSGPAVELRDRILHALRGEGVPAATWQLLPLPASPAFRLETPATWHPDTQDAPGPWDPSAYPETVALLESSIVLGADATPLFIQTQSLMETYIEALRKVVENLDEVFHGPYEPLRTNPEIPSDELGALHAHAGALRSRS
jgi:dTDP-4-amino-4,6-dideoxygalactose transaminase